MKPSKEKTKHNEAKKALVLLSGGADSAAALWWAKKRNWRLASLTFSFPGRRSMEMFCTKKLSYSVGCRENYEVFLSFVSAPEAAQGCYIPKRNLIFYSIASSIAERIKSDFIIGAHHAHDGNIFSDAKRSYLAQINQIIKSDKNSAYPVKLCFPFIHFTKEKIIQMGRLLHVPFQYTWSCSRNGKEHCWRCNSCKERRDGFLKAKVLDPLWN